MFMLKVNFKKLKIYIILIYLKKNTLKYNIYHNHVNRSRKKNWRD